MTSELRVDNLKGSTTGGSITVLAEGTSATTNLQQGLAKSWVNFNGAGTLAVRDSFNTSSVTDTATGKYAPIMTNAMSNTDYCPTVYSNSYNGDSYYGGGRAGVKNNEFTTDSTTTYEVVSYSNNYIDASRNYTHCFGDLA